MAEDGLSKPVDYTSRWSDQGRGRQPPLLGQLANRFTRMTGVIGLHAGFPPDSCFPVTQLQLTLCDGQQASVSTSTELVLSQQYNLNAKGYPPLTDWAKQLTLKLQKPLCEVDTLMTSGATHALDMIFNTLLNPGDAMLCEEYTYSHGFDSLLIPNGYKLMPVRVDQHGLVPEHLAQVLQEASGSWSEATRPKLLYIIPTGHNPSGSVLPMERKQQIYKICQQYDLIIVEDDAYYWLQWGPDGSAPGLDLPPSFLSLDTDGRVIRVDTFAKTLGPGYRLGWVTAVPQVVNKLALASYGVVVGPCSFAQVAVHSMLQAWGEQGYDAFLRKLQRQYGEMAALAHSECERQLAGLAVWHAVQAGMFMWYRLEGIEDSDEVTDALIEQRVVVTPGKAFWTRRSEPGARCNYIRLCFVYVSKEELVEGIARLKTVLQGVRAKRMGAPAEPAAG